MRSNSEKFSRPFLPSRRFERVFVFGEMRLSEWPRGFALLTDPASSGDCIGCVSSRYHLYAQDTNPRDKLSLGWIAI
jgi:hypothetical protein